MLEDYFSYRGVLKRLRSGALGAEMDRIAEHFSLLGYRRASAQIYLSRIGRFSHFAADHCGSGSITEDIVNRYLHTFSTDSPRIGAVSALQHARRVTPKRFIDPSPSVVDDPDAPLLSSFSDYLSRVRGLDLKSRDGVLLGARRFLDWLRHRHPGQDLGALMAEQVLAAVEHRLSLSMTSSTRTSATSHIRTFLRYLLGLATTTRISPASFQERLIGVWPICRLRRAVRQALSKPIALALHAYLEEKQVNFSRSHDLHKAMRYMLKRWSAFTLFLGDGRVCLSNNAAERALRGIALGRRSWLFCGSDRGGQRAAAIYSLIVTAKMNDVDPLAWLTDVLARIATYPAHPIDELLPWNWKALRTQVAAAA